MTVEWAVITTTIELALTTTLVLALMGLGFRRQKLE